MSRFGEKVKKLRIERGLTLRKMGEATGLHWGHISKIEKGQRIPSVLIALKIARFFEVTVDDLADDSVEI
ncbi:helix-turn-helix transcriptional regulator [Anaerolineales bacterium HSG6]|nr:helix-turn-helix transcriptional regulator [Anaerolineales bacterium HSG6]